MNADTSFTMSKQGGFQVREMARKTGMNPSRAFRSMVGAFVRMQNPKIVVTGQPLTTQFEVGISPDNLSRLREVCGNLGMPMECAGELVAMADYTGYSEKWQ